MSDRCNKTRKLSAKKSKHRRCYFKMNKTSGAGAGGGSSNGGENGCVRSVIACSNCAISAKNQMASSMQQFCTDSNIVVNTARKCSFPGKEKTTATTIFETMKWIRFNSLININQQQFLSSHDC